MTWEGTKTNTEISGYIQHNCLFGAWSIRLLVLRRRAGHDLSFPAVSETLPGGGEENMLTRVLMKILKQNHLGACISTVPKVGVHLGLMWSYYLCFGIKRGLSPAASCPWLASMFATSF